MADEIPPWLSHVSDEEKQAHNANCTDGVLYDRSENVVGVPGGWIGYEGCSVCAQDPFKVLRTALEARITALEAQIDTQALSVRLQGQVDALDWTLEAMDKTVVAIHEAFHQDRGENLLIPPEAHQDVTQQQPGESRRENETRREWKARTFRATWPTEAEPVTYSASRPTSRWPGRTGTNRR